MNSLLATIGHPSSEIVPTEATVVMALTSRRPLPDRYLDILPLACATKRTHISHRPTGLGAPAPHAGTPTPRRHSNPCSAKLRYASFPTITWSSTGMSSTRPASTSCLVTALSSADGVGSPDGWL